MAPSFDIGNPQRSIVRVPGSGEDKSLQPTCLDVAQISNFSKSLAEIMKIDFIPSTHEMITGTFNMLQSGVILSGGTQNPVQQVAQTSNTSNQASTSNPRKRSAEEETGETSKKRYATLSPIEREEKRKQLEEEKRFLLEETDQLARKVETFKSILRSRSKLKDFLKALEELPC